MIKGWEIKDREYHIGLFHAVFRNLRKIQCEAHTCFIFYDFHQDKLQKMKGSRKSTRLITSFIDSSFINIDFFHTVYWLRFPLHPFQFFFISAPMRIRKLSVFSLKTNRHLRNNNRIKYDKSKQGNQNITKTTKQDKDSKKNAEETYGDTETHMLALSGIPSQNIPAKDV